jgi:hypothetical protein
MFVHIADIKFKLFNTAQCDKYTKREKRVYEMKLQKRDDKIDYESKLSTRWAIKQSKLKRESRKLKKNNRENNNSSSG